MRTSFAATARTLVALLLSVTLVPAAAAAQGSSLEYTEVTRVEASGVLGALLATSDSEETHGVHLLDGTLRTDEGTTSSIFDSAAAEWTFLDHESRTWYRISLADVREMTAELSETMQQARAEAEAVAEEARAEMEESRREMEEAMAEADAAMDVSVEHLVPGERREVHGYAAERHQIVLLVEEAEGVQGAEEVEGGSLAVVFDLWLSEEFEQANPLYHDGPAEEHPFYEALAENPAFAELAEDMAGAFEPGHDADDNARYAMVDPRVGAAMDEAMERVAELEGAPVSTRTVVAVVPPTVAMDAELILAWEPEGMGDQIRGEATEAAREAARDAARDAVRGFTRGILGGDDDDEAEPPEEELMIRPLFRVTTEVLDVHDAGAPAPDIFAVPDGYREMAIGSGVGAGADPPG